MKLFWKWGQAGEEAELMAGRRGRPEHAWWQSWRHTKAPEAFPGSESGPWLPARAGSVGEDLAAKLVWWGFNRGQAAVCSGVIELLKRVNGGSGRTCV